MDTIFALCMGIGLSAACGFRVFVPLLVMSIANHTGNLSLSPGFDWIGSTPAMVMLSVATALEIAAYYVPWVDNFMDTIATPAAIVAGTVVTASMVSDMSPILKWTLALIAGGGAAGAVQTTTVLARAVSTATTGGLGNPILASVELGGSALAALLAIFVPLMAIALVVGVVIYLAMRAWKKRMPIAV